MSIDKYCGVIPAFYACYEEDGRLSPKRTRSLARHLVNEGVKGLYVGGSSGECIYLEKEERMLMLEAVMHEVRGECTVIAHVACNNTAESCELASHAESLGVDAIASIPPIYFHLPEQAIAQYWNDISAAAPNTDFIIYNIPQLAGVSLTISLLKTMLNNPRIIGVKNSSMPVQDIQMFKSVGGKDFVVFNGPDEQFISGRLIGADGGIGGTYAVMPRLFLKADECLKAGDFASAQSIQNSINEIIYSMCSAKGNLYAVMKAILASNGFEAGGVRKPLLRVQPGDEAIVERCCEMIKNAYRTYEVLT